MNVDFVTLANLFQLFIDVGRDVREAGGDATDPAQVLAELKANPIYRLRLDSITAARAELAELRAQAEDDAEAS